MKRKLYQKIYDDLEEKIQTGVYPLKSQLPPEQELIDTYQVSAITIKRALTELKNSGYISRKPKEGTIVLSEVPTIIPLEKIHEKKTTLVGLIVPKIDSSFGIEILNGILDNTPPNLEIIIKKSNGDIDKEDELLKEMMETRIDGIILLPTSSEYLSPTLLSIISSNFPIVVLDRILDGLPVSSVTVNNEQTAQTLTNYLFSNGHRQIGFISSSSHISSVSDREKGFVNAHAMSGLPLDTTLIKHFITSDVLEEEDEKKRDIKKIQKFISANPTMTAIFSTEYETALLIHKACQNLKLKIPDDLSLVCYDHPIGNFMEAPFIITHIEQDQYEMGQATMRIIHNKIKKNSTIEKFIAQGILIQGSSVKMID